MPGLMADLSMHAPEIAVWTDAAHAALAGQVLDLMGGQVRPIAVGAADGSADGQLAQWARTLDAPSFRDLRKLRIDRPTAFLLCTTGLPPAATDLRELAKAGTTVLLLTPPADDARALADLAAPGVAERLVRTPRFDACPGLSAAAEPQHAFEGRPARVHLASHGPPTHGSLFARAFDAWRVALLFAPLPETIDASLQRPAGTPAAQHPAELVGRMSAHARSADGSAVTLQLSDRSLASQRRLRVNADHADLEATDAAYTLHTDDPSRPEDPAQIETNAPDPAPTGPQPIADHPPFADLIAGHFRRLLDRPPLPTSPIADRHALACVQACQLSARTGQPERPDQLLLTGI
ncbi:MAG: hypothetical protein AAGE65_12550 [Planctomycetota bacterium]